MGDQLPSLAAARAKRTEASRALAAGDVQTATALAREALGLYMPHRDPAWLIAEAEIVLSQCQRASGDQAGALERANAACERTEAAPEAAVLYVHSLAQLGTIFMDMEMWEEACGTYERALHVLDTSEHISAEIATVMRGPIEQSLDAAEDELGIGGDDGDDA